MYLNRFQPTSIVSNYCALLNCFIIVYDSEFVYMFDNKDFHRQKHIVPESVIPSISQSGLLVIADKGDTGPGTEVLDC